MSSIWWWGGQWAVRRGGAVSERCADRIPAWEMSPFQTLTTGLEVEDFQVCSLLPIFSCRMLCDKESKWTLHPWLTKEKLLGSRAILPHDTLQWHKEGEIKLTKLWGEPQGTTFKPYLPICIWGELKDTAGAWRALQQMMMRCRWVAIHKNRFFLLR